jgi:hypothetical protein
MANYPSISRFLLQNADTNVIQEEIISWANQIAQELDLRDNQVDSTPSTKIYAVVTVTDIGRPSSGDVAFSKGEGKFKGFVSGTGWVNFN